MDGSTSPDSTAAGKPLVAHFKRSFLYKSEIFIRVLIDSNPGFDHMAVSFEFLDGPLADGIPRCSPPAVDLLMQRLAGWMPVTSAELRRRGVVLVHAHFGRDGWIASSFAGSRRRMPLVVSFYGRDASTYLRIPAWRSRFTRLFHSADRILVLSEHMKGMLTAAGCPESSIVVHSLGVDLQAFPLHARRLPGDGSGRLLFVGRLVPKKGLHVAIEALAMLPGFELDVAGDGPGLADAMQLAARSGVSDRIRFTGWQSPAEVAGLMAGAHALLVPSITGPDGDMEGAPMVIFEAMASGLPVVGTDHAGIPEQLDFGGCGRIVPESDPAALAEAVRSIFESEGSYQGVVAAARSRVETRFDAARQGRILEGIYRELIRQRI